MAGHGKFPKPTERLADPAQRKAREAGMKVVQAEPTAQPPLPMTYGVGGVRYAWPEETKRWWAMWGRSPLTLDFTENDWSELLDTALLHAKYWTGDTKVAAELRLRAASFGATPEARARLKITFAQADEAETKRRTHRAAADDRGSYKGLKAVDE